MSGALLAAIALGRAFVIDYSSLPDGWRSLFAPLPTGWDLASMRQSLPLDTFQATRAQLAGCAELLDDTVAVIVVETMTCLTFEMLMAEAAFSAFLPLFPSREVFHVQAAVSHVLFQPSAELRSEVDLQRARWGARRVVGIAVREGAKPGDNLRLLPSSAGREHEVWDVFADCARAAAMESDVAFFIVSDTPAAKTYLRQALGKERTFVVDVEMEHFSNSSAATLRKTLIEWFTLAEVSDAVLTAHSTFGLTAFARTGRVPSSVSREGPGFVCSRRMWDQSPIGRASNESAQPS